jgi:segregation and condensation protein B
VSPLAKLLEAALFASSRPVPYDELRALDVGADEGTLEAALDELRRHYDDPEDGHAFELVEQGGGWQLLTRPEFTEAIERAQLAQRPQRLSAASLETLAIIAYRQPITAPEVTDIRGVNSTGVIRTLLERHMIRVAGRKAVVGSPFLYRTTREFLIHFGLNDIRDLPRLEEFGDLIGETISEELVEAVQSASVEQPE